MKEMSLEFFSMYLFTSEYDGIYFPQCTHYKGKGFDSLVLTETSQTPGTTSLNHNLKTVDFFSHMNAKKCW